MRMDVELRFPSIGPVDVGGPAEQLLSLGRVPRPTDDGLLLDAIEDGYTVSTEGDRVTGFVLFWQFPVSFIQGRRFRGQIFDDGRLLPLSRSTTVDDVLSIFGVPYWRDERFRHDGSGANTLLFYERGEVEIQISFCGDRMTLYELVVVSPPMLADEGQRRAYGIDRFWPPT